MPWKDYRSYGDSTRSYEGPSPAVIERAEDKVYELDFAAMVEVARPSMGSVETGTQLIERVARIVRVPSDALSHEQPYIDFVEFWGFPALLRVLATAITQESK